MLRTLVTLLLVVGAHHLQAQTCVVSGTVVDRETGNPLAFVNLLVSGQPVGTATDIDGKFQLIVPESSGQFNVSYVGYEPLSVSFQCPTGPLKIELKTTGVDLAEVEIRPGENPAHRMILAARDNRNLNRPENLESYRCIVYNKFIATSEDVDQTATWLKVSLNDSTETKAPEGDSARGDSAAVKTREFFEKQHLFMMESVVERTFKRPAKLKQKVVSSRVSGFQDPSFFPLATNLQPFSFYENVITLKDKPYLSPIGPSALRDYRYQLQDTLFTGTGDSIFVIAFEPRTDNQLKRLSGVISLHSRQWAIQNVRAKPADTDMALRIEQLYNQLPNGQWFPHQLHVDLPILGDGLVISGRSYIDSVKADPVIQKRTFNHLSVEWSDDAVLKDTAWWNRYRGDTLDYREQNTYQVIDSIGEDIDLDGYIYKFRALSEGRYPYKFVDIDFTNLFLYNRYENLRLGLGLYTNPKVFKDGSFGGYFAYGFGDQAWKYGFSGEWQLSRSREMRLAAGYRDDVVEPGNPWFHTGRAVFNTDRLRQFLPSNMNRYREAWTTLDFRLFPSVETQLGFRDARVNITGDYRFRRQADQVSVLSQEFQVTEARVGFRWAPGEERQGSPTQVISLPSDKPVFWLTLRKGLEGNDIGSFNYERVDLRINHRFTWRKLGRTDWRLEAGWMQGELPVTELAYAPGAAVDAYRVFIPNTFQTMNLYEFLSDRYAQLFLSHQFQPWQPNVDWSRPQLVLYHGMAIGELEEPEPHSGIVYKTLEDGFIESGVGLQDLYRKEYFGSIFIGFGVSTFYRYGANTLPDQQDNFSYKINFTVTL